MVLCAEKVRGRQLGFARLMAGYSSTLARGGEHARHVETGAARPRSLSCGGDVMIAGK